MSVPLVNNDDAAPMIIERVDISCACTRVIDRPERIAPGGTATIQVCTTPNAFNANATVSVTVHGRTSSAIQAHSTLDITAVVPFSGWPASAIARRDGGFLFVEVAPEYVAESLIAGVQAFGRGLAAPLGVEIRGSEIRIENTANVQVDLVVKFGSEGDAVWSGPVFAPGS